MAIGERGTNVAAGRSGPPAWLLLTTIVILWSWVRPLYVDGMSMKAGRDLHQLSAGATLIVRGTVVASEPHWQEKNQGGQTVARGGIYTTVKIRVSDLIKGILPDSVLTFERAGGTVGETTVEVFDDQPFPVAEKEDAILFLEDTPLGLQPIWNGVMLVRDGKVRPDERLISAAAFTQYLRLIGNGQKTTLASFLQTLPPEPPPPVFHGGGKVPVEKVRYFNKHTDSGAVYPLDTVRVDTSWFHDPINDADSTPKPRAPVRDDGAKPVGPVFHPPPKDLSAVFRLDPPDREKTSTPGRSSVPPATSAGVNEVDTWQNIRSESFETSFPEANQWELSGSPTWDDWDYTSEAGLWSGYCVGSSVTPYGPYPDNVDSWMISPAFDLTNAVDARVTFWYRNKSESGYDFFNWYVSIDHSVYHGWQVTGDENSWRSVSFDLKTVPILGNICGQSQVWFAFEFTSDATVGDIGAFVDNIVIEEVVPLITSITPSHQSAGTGATVTVSGSYFGASQGSGKVEFFYQGGSNDPKIPATITSWSNTQITCDVPIAIIANYPASSGSGPVTVTNSSGKRTPDFNYIVSFGYGQRKWPGSDPYIHFRVNENTSDCVGEANAVKSAASTWNLTCARFAFRSDGTNTNADATPGDGFNDIVWGSLPIGTLASTSIESVS